MNFRVKRTAVYLSALLILGATPLHAAEREDLETLRQTTKNLIDLLVQQGVLTQEKATQLVQQAETSAAEKVAAQKKAEAGVVRVQYVPEAVKEEMREQIKQEVLAQAKGERWGDPGALPAWLNRISWEGDIRLRYQYDGFAPGNTAPALVQSAYGLYSYAGSLTTVSGDSLFLAGDTSDPRQRARLRARLGMNAKISDEVSGGIRLATGSSNDPLSTNQTLGNTSQKYSLWVDLAYLKLEPYSWLTLTGGRIVNPWLSTDLVWHPDLTFEGAFAKVAPRISENQRVSLGVGAFPLQDITKSTSNRAENKWLFGAQAGWEWTSLNSSSMKLGVALYDYQHVEGILEAVFGQTYYSYTAPQYRQKGNSVFYDTFDGQYKLLSKFRELNITGVLDLAKFDPVHLTFTGDFVKNVGFDQAEILSRTGQNIDPKTRGYMARFDVGYPKVEQRGDWKAFVGYKYLERDAVLDAFTDSDFHLGGTDARGFFVGGSYGIDKNTWLTLRWMSADEISGAQGFPIKLGIDTLQLDLNAKF